MPRYYFDTDDDGVHCHDEESVELDDAEMARKEATGILPDIARDVLPSGDRHDFVSSVWDEAGDIIKARLSLVGGWVGKTAVPR